MATIVTVHGTFASGAETGPAWWQKGSAFETDLRAYVEGSDGRLDIVPHVWDGLNSETSRRTAGIALANRLDTLDNSGERYCIVGHSHGGSVAAAALMRSVHQRRARPGLALWITTGTPFIGLKRKKLLFSRLGMLGRAGYVALFSYSALLSLAFLLEAKVPDFASAVVAVVMFSGLFILSSVVMAWYTDRRLAETGAAFSVTPSSWLSLPRLGLFGRLFYLAAAGLAMLTLLIVTFGTPPQVQLNVKERWIGGGAALAAFAAVHVVTAWLPHRLPRLLGRKRVARREVVAKWTACWLPLRHPDDEAVAGLGQLPKVSFPIFGRDFAVAPLTLAAVIAFPLLLAAIVASPAAMGLLADVATKSGLADNNLVAMRRLGAGDNIANNILFLLMLPVVAVMRFVISPATSNDVKMAIVMVLGPFLFFLAAMLLISAARLLATMVSRVLSRFLDRLAWRQIRASAYGSDTLGEVAQGAGDAPHFARSRACLPAELSAEIRRVADEAAAKAIPKLRSSLNRLAFAEDGRARSDLVSDYLTWDELIHTAYFKVPQFNKLIAYAIAQSEGFRPTARFLADAEYQRVAGWYRELAAAKGSAGAVKT